MTQAEKSTARIIRPEQDDLSEQAIVDYLQAKPDFFQGFPQLLESLHIPHENGPAISLVERQVNLLREKNTLLEEQLNLLISIARDNNETQQQIHQMVLEVLAIQQAEPALQYLTSTGCSCNCFSTNCTGGFWAGHVPCGQGADYTTWCGVDGWGICDPSTQTAVQTCH